MSGQARSVWMQPDAQPVPWSFQGRALRQAAIWQYLHPELRASKHLGSRIEFSGRTSYALSMVSPGSSVIHMVF